jgi:hypothetical protein
MASKLTMFKITPLYSTRYPELGYQQHGRGLWRIIDCDGNAAVGPQYHSKAELLADLSRYASEVFGLK